MKKHKLVLIEWIDAAGCGPRWNSLDVIMSSNTLTIRSVGWLVDESTKHVTIVSSMDNQEAPQCMGDHAIPRSAIKSMMTLKVPKKWQMP